MIRDFNNIDLSESDIKCNNTYWRMFPAFEHTICWVVNLVFNWTSWTYYLVFVQCNNIVTTCLKSIEHLYVNRIEKPKCTEHRTPRFWTLCYIAYHVNIDVRVCYLFFYFLQGLVNLGQQWRAAKLANTIVCDHDPSISNSNASTMSICCQSIWSDTASS